MRLVCCVCQRTQEKGSWKPLPVDMDEQVTHGYCPDCFAVVMSDLQRLVSGKQGNQANCPTIARWKRARSQGDACA